MRIAVLSDIHSNVEALDAVLDRAQTEDAGATVVLGDIVGYGADPVAVVERLRSLPRVTMIAGNHDLAATQRFDTTWFNSAAEAAIRWTRAALDDDTMRTLTALEPRGALGEALLVHGSVVDPAAQYVFNADQAGESFDAEPFTLCFFGHTHMPTLFEAGPNADRPSIVKGQILGDREPVELREGRFMLNPGSVGQPRDADPRASFMIFDTERSIAVVHRVPYDIAGAQRKIYDAGLPTVLGDRLAVGR